MKPFFSIVIPTRNRANYPRYAIYSALNQSFDDYEVVVVECDNWEFALSKAQGKYIAFLGDDDFMVKDFLAICYDILKSGDFCEREVELIHILVASFNYHDYNLYLCRSGNNKIEILYSMDMFKRYFEGVNAAPPKPHAGVVSSQLYNRIKQKFGRVFFPYAPDISSAFLMLYMTKWYIRLSIPIIIFGVSPVSYGYGGLREARKIIEFLEEFGVKDGDLKKSPYGVYTPLPQFLTVSNMVMDTMLRTVDIISKHEGIDVRELYNRFGISERDTMRNLFMRIEDELKRLGNKRKLRECEFLFLLWKLKQFFFGIFRDRKYILDVLTSRLNRLGDKIISGDTNEEENIEVVPRKFSSILDAGIWLNDYINFEILKHGKIINFFWE